MMKVTDQMRVNVPGRVSNAPLQVTISPDYREKYLVVQVQFRGFKRAAIVNPAIRAALGSYGAAVEFAERWLISEFGYERASVTTC